MNSTAVSMTTNPTSKTKVTLTGPQETLLATLIGRKHDAESAVPILGDRWAAQIVDRIDYDFSRMGMDPGKAAGVSMRARLLDLWTMQFLQQHPSATVIHLACGLDTRCLRVEYGPGVRWIDVDLPDVEAVRKQIVPEPSASNEADTRGEYRLVGASAAAPTDWLNDIPSDRPTVVVFEGLSMYLREDDLRTLIQAIVSRFGTAGGQLLFDCFGTIGLWLQSWMKPVENSGSTLYFGTDDTSVFQEWCPELKLVDDLRPMELMNQKDVPVGAVPWSTRTVMWAFSLIPWVRDSGRTLRFDFRRLDSST